MVLSIKDGNLTVSVDIVEDDDNVTQSELLLMAALEAIGCVIGGGSAVAAYYHIDPDTLELRDEDDQLWKLYQKYSLNVYKHITEKE